MYLSPVILSGIKASEVPRKFHAREVIRLKLILEHIQSGLPVTSRNKQTQFRHYPRRDTAVLRLQVLYLSLIKPQFGTIVLLRQGTNGFRLHQSGLLADFLADKPRKHLPVSPFGMLELRFRLLRLQQIHPNRVQIRLVSNAVLDIRGYLVAIPPQFRLQHFVLLQLRLGEQNAEIQLVYPLVDSIHADIHIPLVHFRLRAEGFPFRAYRASVPERLAQGELHFVLVLTYRRNLDARQADSVEVDRNLRHIRLISSLRGECHLRQIPLSRVRKIIFLRLFYQTVLLDKRIIRPRFLITRLDAKLGETRSIRHKRKEENDCLYSHIHLFYMLIDSFVCFVRQSCRFKYKKRLRAQYL